MFRPIALLLACLGLSGCESISYYGQAARGQWQLLQAREPIDSLIDEANTDEILRQQLTQIVQLREFADHDLLLNANGSYHHFADLQRPYAVWAVFAAPAFSVEAKQWCYFVAGCAFYRGYFQRQSAQQYADSLAEQELDTYVAGIAAYSTLGWFADPVLNTYIDWQVLDQAKLIFHELAHQRLYIAGDTAFNESFAEAVAVIGVERWLAQQSGSAALPVTWQQQQKAETEFVAMVIHTRTALAELYQQPIGAALKREKKQALMSALQTTDFDSYVARWPSGERYRHWVETGMNNAKLATVTGYHRWLPALLWLYQQQEDDMHRFYQAVERLQTLPAAQREKQLTVWLEAAG